MSGYHSTRYGVVRLDFMLWRVRFCDRSCRIRETRVRWVRLRLSCGYEVGVGIEYVLHSFPSFGKTAIILVDIYFYFFINFKILTFHMSYREIVFIIYMHH